MSVAKPVMADPHVRHASGLALLSAWPRLVHRPMCALCRALPLVLPASGELHLQSMGTQASQQQPYMVKHHHVEAVDQYACFNCMQYSMQMAEPSLRLSAVSVWLLMVLFWQDVQHSAAVL